MSLSWLAVSTFLQKAWVWCKHHWKLALLALWTAVIWVVAKKNINAHKKVLSKTIESYKEQIGIIDRTYQDELEERNKALEAYNEIMVHLDHEYKSELDALTFQKRAKIKTLIDSYYNDTEELNRRLEGEFGFKYVK